MLGAVSNDPINPAKRQKATPMNILNIMGIFTRHNTTEKKA